jgi:hypothetical protein
VKFDVLTMAECCRKSRRKESKAALEGIDDGVECGRGGGRVVEGSLVIGESDDTWATGRRGLGEGRPRSKRQEALHRMGKQMSARFVDGGGKAYHGGCGAYLLETLHRLVALPWKTTNLGFFPFPCLSK